MEECLITDKVCSNTNKKCKECKLDDCNQTFQIIEKREKSKEYKLKKEINKEIPDECKRLSFFRNNQPKRKKDKVFLQCKERLFIKILK